MAETMEQMIGRWRGEIQPASLDTARSAQLACADDLEAQLARLRELREDLRERGKNPCCTYHEAAAAAYDSVAETLDAILGRKE